MNLVWDIRRKGKRTYKFDHSYKLMAAEEGNPFDINQETFNIVVTRNHPLL